MEEELLARQMPHSAEAEQAVLGAMLIEERCVPTVVEQLTPDDFYVQQNRDIYEAIYSMFNNAKDIDPVTVLDEMRLKGTYDEQSSYSYMLQLMAVTPSPSNVTKYVDIVKDKTLLRRIAETMADVT